jgi:hypothetical protein
VLVREVVAERDQVDEVVGMEMADDDRIQVARLRRRHEARERALAELEEDSRAGRTDKV